MSGVELIADERKRQVEFEGWFSNHDDGHGYDQLAIAACCYALPSRLRGVDGSYKAPPHMWPWGSNWWKPTPNDRIRELVKAGALIAAEIDRLKRGTP